LNLEFASINDYPFKSCAMGQLQEFPKNSPKRISMNLAPLITWALCYYAHLELYNKIAIQKNTKKDFSKFSKCNAFFSLTLYK
jgi:hypothetical protein